jgi:nucleoporin SEH1
MEFIQLTESQHDVHIHDIAFDFYGKRFATCSTDAKINIWDFDLNSGLWVGTEISDCHNKTIWRLSWAHPEFGNIIASCSEDQIVKIWEEQTSVTRSQIENPERWLQKAQLTDSKKAVNDVKFGPRHLGLKLASASADGVVRIYEALDVFSLNYWQLQV